MLQTFNFRVEMPCSSCAGHVKQLLQAQIEKGSVQSFTVDQKEKLVKITTHLNLDDIQAELKKCGKPVTFLSSVNASIFNPGQNKFPQPPPPPKKENQNLQGQGPPTINRPSTQPAGSEQKQNATYKAPPRPPLPSIPNWNGGAGTGALPNMGGQGQGQNQASPQSFVRASQNMKQRLNGLALANNAPDTVAATTVAPSPAAIAAVHQSILNGPPPQQPTFKSFPAPATKLNSNQNQPEPTLPRSGSGQKPKKASLSLSRRKRSQQNRNSKNQQGSASVVVLSPAATQPTAVSTKELSYGPEKNNRG